VEVFDGGADDVGVGEAGGEHTGYKVGEGADAVHEDPEAGEGVGGGKNAGVGELVFSSSFLLLLLWALDGVGKGGRSRLTR